jgi:hypothetical protein
MPTPRPLKYQEKIVAFLDILGFKEIVKKSESDTTKIELLSYAVEYLKGLEGSDNWNLKLIEIEEDAQRKGVRNFDISKITKVTSFSDSVVVSVTVKGNVNEVLSTLIANLAYLGAIFMEKGMLFRGGITIGNLIHKSNGTVFGQALIDAYELESRSAKFPRVILSDKLLSILNYPRHSKRERYPYHQYLYRFDDGCVGFHQMIYYQVVESWTEMNHKIMAESLDKVRRVIISGLDNSFESPDIYMKYKWLSEQYNKLLILGDFNKVTKKRTTPKKRIRKLNEDLAGNNIHFSHRQLLQF